MEVALKNGYRYINCAHNYGNEPEIAEALQKCFKEGVCKREDLFITSKLWYITMSILRARVHSTLKECATLNVYCILHHVYRH